ncbi:MAG: Trk system potassium transporter TrkA [Roseburia sp.]|nr:Trk system potassium transporter TrkA [Oscillibacter sp.]MCM1440888.1 Trk system potassium transporter TrkA [Roseburia sp.]
MNIVIAGAGAVGTHLAKMLSRQEHNILLLDSDQEKIENLESQLDIMSIVGSCTSIGALKDAEVGKCDLYIAVNPLEEQNINSAILAKKLGAKRTIARVNNSEYLENENAEYLKSIGIDTLIYPERLAAEEIVASLKQIGSRQLHEFSDGRLQLIGIKLWDNALILNHTLAKMGEIYGADQFRVVAIKREDKTIIPRGNDTLKYGDLIFVVTTPSFIPNVFTLCGKEEFEIKNIVIVGASRIGVKTASLLEKNYNVKIIEKDREKCIQLADKLKSTLIINGDGRDLGLLREEGIKNIDAFISVTKSSETNILSCLLAKKMGVKKSVAEVENIDYIDLAENIGIGTLINTKLIAASHIYRYTMNVDVKHLKFLTFSEAEVFELEAEEGARITKHELKDVHFPEDATIGGVIRGDKTIIAKGDVQIMPGDNVVIFALPNAVKKVIKYFQK